MFFSFLYLVFYFHASPKPVIGIPFFNAQNALPPSPFDGITHSKSPITLQENDIDALKNSHPNTVTKY